MMRRRSCLNKFIRTRNIKIAFMIQCIVTTTAMLYTMYETRTLDESSRWELDLTEGRCRGCCGMHNDSLKAILSEPYLSEKLHKFSRAVRKYDIPENILNILHEAEHKIQLFENEIHLLKKEKSDRILKLQDTLIEEDIKDQDLTPKGKPKWKKQSKKPTNQPSTAPKTQRNAPKTPSTAHKTTSKKTTLKQPSRN